MRFENQKVGYSFGFTLDEINVLTVNEKGKPEFLDRTLEENKMKDLYKRLFVKEISIYWNSNERSIAFLGNANFSDDQKRSFLKNSILRKDKKQPNMTPILSISLECQIIFKNANKEDLGKDPRYRLEIDLLPINITLNNEQVNQMMSLLNFFNKSERDRKREWKLFQLTLKEDPNDKTLYRKNLIDLLLSVEESEYKWSEELNHPKKKALSDPIKTFLGKLSNDTLAEVSREVIIKDEKRRLMHRMEKKMGKKGVLSLLKSDQDEKKEHLELKKLADSFDAFIQENAERIGENLMKGFVCEVNIRLSQSSFNLVDAKSPEKQGLLALVNNTRLKLQYHNHQEYDLGRVEFLINDFKLSLQKEAREITVITKFYEDSTQDFASLIVEMKNHSKDKSFVNQMLLIDLTFNFIFNRSSIIWIQGIKKLLFTQELESFSALD